MKLLTFKNANNEIIDRFSELLRLDQRVRLLLKDNQSRVDMIQTADYICLVLFLGEYNKFHKRVEQVELDILFDRYHRQAYLFSFHSDYFLEKYANDLESIYYNNFGNLMSQLMDLFVKDEEKMIQHILQDTQVIRNEYLSKDDPAKLIRHLTNNQINISSMQLILANQNKAWDIISKFLNNVDRETISYKKDAVFNELKFASEFCAALMNSLNTRFELKTSKDIYNWTRYTTIAILGAFVFQVIDFVSHDNSNLKLLSIIGIGACIIILIWTIIQYRRNI